MATLQKPAPEATATDRPEQDTETASVEVGKNVAKGSKEPVVETGAGSNGVAVAARHGNHHHHHSSSSGLSGHTEDEHAHLRLRTQVTHEGEAYCPNPNIRDLPKEFETRVTVIQRYPEMKTVEKTEYVKEIHHEERVIIVPKTRVIMEEIEHVDRIPVVREVAKTRIEIFHRVITEEREVTEMVPVIEYVDVPRIEQVPRVVIEEVEEKITVPVVREVPVTRLVEVPTGNYCEAPAGEFINPGHFNLLGHKHHKHKSKSNSGGLIAKLTRSSSSSSSSLSSDDEKRSEGVLAVAPTVHHADGTTTLDPSHSKRKNFLQRIIHH